MKVSYMQICIVCFLWISFVVVSIGVVPFWCQRFQWIPVVVVRFLPIVFFSCPVYATCKMAALQLLRQGNVMSPETIVVAPSFSQHVRNVIVRVALTRNTKYRHLFWSCGCRVFLRGKSVRYIGIGFFCLGFVFPRRTHGFDCLQGSFVQVWFLGNAGLHRLLIQTRGTVKETFVMFGHVLLQVFSETESNELQQLSGAVLQLQHTRLQKFQADLPLWRTFWKLLQELRSDWPCVPWARCEWRSAHLPRTAPDYSPSLVFRPLQAPLSWRSLCAVVDLKGVIDTEWRLLLIMFMMMSSESR